jgi:hypothetical protein
VLFYDSVFAIIRSLDIRRSNAESQSFRIAVYASNLCVYAWNYNFVNIYVYKDQGDQIGRIFAYWALVYFGLFFENYISSTNSLATFSKCISYAFILTKSGLGDILGKFFTNSSGHPDIGMYTCEPAFVSICYLAHVRITTYT